MPARDAPTRRDLLAGLPLASIEHHIVGLVVHARPEQISHVLGALRAMPPVEVHGENRDGKIVLTLDARSEDEIVQTMGHIGELPGVLSTALVYQGTA
jgi:nitrate reductase NapD